MGTSRLERLEQKTRRERRFCDRFFTVFWTDVVGNPAGALSLRLVSLPRSKEMGLALHGWSVIKDKEVMNLATTLQEKDTENHFDKDSSHQWLPARRGILLEKESTSRSFYFKVKVGNVSLKTLLSSLDIFPCTASSL
ncbi:hypothetical protein [Bowmanella pacifica]|uniref:hypothetical protein n=1 Tax=Bowmanella pacifica TaxID=502051 RepID=UPI001662B32D|nr:hypothetical protein [Bowmanella pacifica]